MAFPEGPLRSRDLVRGAMTVLAYPAIMGTALAVGAFGFSHGWRREPLIASISVLAGALIVILERIHPLHRSWNVSRGDVTVDAIHTTISMVVAPELLRALTFAAMYSASVWLTERIGFSLWPRRWPFFAQVAVALLIADFFYYWVHRLQHETNFLWRIHSVHHSAPRMYWLNAGRFHPFDTISTYVFQGPALVLLGCPATVLGMFVLFTAVNGLFKHSNVRLRLGPLNWLVSMAELHRWHHSPVFSEASANYGSNVMLWDMLFRTRFHPTDREPPEDVGIADMPNYPRGYVNQLLFPFRKNE